MDPPDGVKLIGCKWIYKRKRRVDGKVKIFKAWLVVKGLHPGRRFLEIFSPVAMRKSIRILSFIAAHMDYQIWQMDVKITFLNESLEKTIYMVQVDSLILMSSSIVLAKFCTDIVC